MQVTIGREFKFEAAHHLPLHKGKCANLHGHTYTMLVELTGEVDERTGMLLDFYDLKRVVEVVVDRCDHHDLNNIFSFTPTVELLVGYFVITLARAFPQCDLVTVQLQEGTGGYARATIRKEEK